MDEGTALKFAALKMEEQGILKYTTVYRHLQLKPNATLRIAAGSEVYILSHSNAAIRLESTTGVYDQTDTGLNELQHIHTGAITLTNHLGAPTEVKFIQTIPHT